MALSGIGTIMSTRAQNSAMKKQVAERARVTQDEMNRQNEFQDQSSKLLENAVAGFERPKYEQAQDDSAEARFSFMDKLRQSVPDFTPAAASGAGAPSIVSDEMKRMGAQSDQYTQNLSKALARLGGGSDAVQKGLREMARKAGDIGTISNYARGSARILPLEQQAAAFNNQAPSFGIGDVLGLAGSGLTMAGMTGFNPFGGTNPAINFPDVMTVTPTRKPF